MPMNCVAQSLPDQFQVVLLARARNVSLANTGDVLINGNPILPLIGSPSRYCVTQVVVSNPLVNGVSGTIATGALGIFTAANATGTVAANVALSPTQTTGTTAAQSLPVTAATTTVLTAPALFANVGTAVANATCDISIYGQVLAT
jgi:hypothetical protein